MIFWGAHFDTKHRLWNETCQWMCVQLLTEMCLGQAASPSRVSTSWSLKWDNKTHLVGGCRKTRYEHGICLVHTRCSNTAPFLCLRNEVLTYLQWQQSGPRVPMVDRGFDWMIGTGWEPSLRSSGLSPAETCFVGVGSHSVYLGTVWEFSAIPGKGNRAIVKVLW